jgi:asparagine synthetase B (glutamine-hydrolysing)
MCGIFGYVGVSLPDAALLRAIALRASTRGPDGFGIAIQHPDKPTDVIYGDGCLSDSIGILKKATGASAVLGHCRLPTQGGREARHPFKCGDGWLVHNGNVYDLEKYDCQTFTGCDTEVLALELEKRDSINNWQFEQTLVEMHGSVPFVAGFLSPSCLALARRGHPLFMLATSDGVYFSSRSFDGATMLDGFFQRNIFKQV